jgi:hypothetical protein
MGLVKRCSAQMSGFFHLCRHHQLSPRLTMSQRFASSPRQYDSQPRTPNVAENQDSDMLHSIYVLPQPSLTPNLHEPHTPTASSIESWSFAGSPGLTDGSLSPWASTDNEESSPQVSSVPLPHPIHSRWIRPLPLHPSPSIIHPAAIRIPLRESSCVSTQRSCARSNASDASLSDAASAASSALEQSSASSLSSRWSLLALLAYLFRIDQDTMSLVLDPSFSQSEAMDDTEDVVEAQANIMSRWLSHASHEARGGLLREGLQEFVET